LVNNAICFEQQFSLVNTDKVEQIKQEELFFNCSIIRLVALFTIIDFDDDIVLLLLLSDADDRFV